MIIKGAYKILFLLLLIIGGCNQQEEISNDNIIVADKFEEVLLDMSLIEGHVNAVRINQAMVKDSISYFYNEIFNKHNITQDEFESTLDFYASEPILLKEIYEKVLETLSAQEAALAEVQIEQKVITPIGKHMLADIIVEAELHPLFLNDTADLNQIRDSIFKFMIFNDSVLEKNNINLESFQQSFNNITHKIPMYVSLKNDISERVNKLNESK